MGYCECQWRRLDTDDTPPDEPKEITTTTTQIVIDDTQNAKEEATEDSLTTPDERRLLPNPNPSPFPGPHLPNPFPKPPRPNYCRGPGCVRTFTNGQWRCRCNGGIGDQGPRSLREDGSKSESGDENSSDREIGQLEGPTESE